MNKDNLNINFEKINYFALLLLAMSINFPQKIVIYTLAFWFISCVPVLKFKNTNKSNSYSNIPLILLGILTVGRIVVSLFHRDLAALAFKLFDTQLTLLILPLVLYFQNNKLIDVKRVLTVYLIGCFISCIVAVVYFYLYRFNILHENVQFPIFPLGVIHTTFADDIYLFQNYITLYFKHRAGMGANLVMAIACVVYLINQTKKNTFWKIIGASVVGGFIICVLYATGSRSAFISLFVILLFSIVYLFFKKKKTLIIAFLSLTILLMGISTLKTTRSLLINEVSTLEYDKIRVADPRFQIWESAIEIISENTIIGVGYSEIIPQLLKKYKEKNLAVELKERLNSHNQFFQFALESGIWASIIYAIILLPIYFGKELQYLSFSFSTILLFFSLFEDALIGINGISFFAFFVAIFVISEKNNTKESED